MSLFCYFLAGLYNLFWIILGDKLSLWTQIGIPILTIGTVGLGAAVRLFQLRGRAKKAYLRGILWVVLIYYLAILSVVLFFGGLFHLDRAWIGQWNTVNLEPLHTIRNFLRHYQRTKSLSSLLNLLGNVVILIPLGVLFPVMFRPMRRWYCFLPLAAALSVCVEYIQWRTATGIADIDDSILNFAGAVLGYLFTRLCQGIYGHITNIRDRPLGGK